MDSFEFAYNKALRFLSYRQRSEKEVRENLQKRLRSGDYFEPGTIEKVVEKLKEQKFLNDEEFARMWIESRNRSKPRSQRLLAVELRRKGISDEIIESRIMNHQSSGETDLDLAKKIVETKIEKLKHLERNEIYKKLGGLLARRGFNWDTIRHAIDDGLK
jgi:regulatory protein